MEDACHLKQVILPEECADYMKRLKKEVPWQKMKWGRGYLPRLVYRVDGKIPEPIQDLITYTEASFECTVQSVWCNYYQSGNDYTPPHQDNYGAHVITYSFGGSRRFICESLATKTKKEYLLRDGDVFYFSPNFDKLHKHSIPKTTKAVDPRISIVLFTDVPYSQSHLVIEKPIDKFQITSVCDEFNEGEVLIGDGILFFRSGDTIIECLFDKKEDIAALVAALYQNSPFEK